MSTMETPLWSGLPAEVEERILTFLPVPELCRLRSICKRWNSLISSPSFKTANRDTYYIVGRYFGREGDASSRRDIGWCILDLGARRWYTISADTMDASEVLNPLAMDNGLVCEHIEDPRSMDLEITLCNPLCASPAKVLPIPPCHWYTQFYPYVNLVVDDGYKVFLINRAFLKMLPEDPIMRVFESATGHWRSLANPPAMLEDGEDQGVGARVSSVVFQGLLYVLFKSYTNVEYWLFCYDAVEDTWKETRVVIPGRATHDDVLVVSGGRLFLVRSSSDLQETVAILELGKQDSKVVFRMVRELVLRIFHVEERGYDTNLHIQAFGFGTSVVVVSSETGLSIVYDLETCSWETLPPVPVDRLRFEFKFFGGKAMSQLRLPGSPF